MNNKKTVDVLNALLEINNDRIEGYETAAKETEEADLKEIFATLAKTSSQCISELTPEIIKLGGTPTDGTKISGKFFRVWMDVKAALTGKDRKAILNSCEYGEDKAVETYEDTIEEDADELSAEQREMVSSQLTLLKADHDQVKFMRDSIAA